MIENTTQSDRAKQISGWRFHLSVDDVFDSLIEVADSESGLLEHAFFAFLASLHQQFGTEVDVYLFAEGEVDGQRRSLAQLPDRLRAEFEASPWLRVGPHAQCYEVKPFEQSLKQQLEMFEGLFGEIDRFAGCNSRSRWLRLHYFSECYEAGAYLSQQGIESLLLTDKPAVAYRLGEPDRLTLDETGVVQHHGLELRRSFPRVETLVEERWDDAKLEQAIRTSLERHGYVALFSHEIDLKREDVRMMTIRCLNALKQLGVEPS